MCDYNKEYDLREIYSDNKKKRSQKVKDYYYFASDLRIWLVLITILLFSVILCLMISIFCLMKGMVKGKEGDEYEAESKSELLY